MTISPADWRARLRDPEAFADLMARERIGRFATLNARGPHVTPIGFLWDGTSAWIASQIQTQRFVDLQRDPRVTLLVEPAAQSPFDGYVEIIGTAEVVGSVPCLGADPETADVEDLWARSMDFDLRLVHDGLHAWVRIDPVRVIQVRSVIANHDDEAYRIEAERAMASRATRADD